MSSKSSRVLISEGSSERRDNDNMTWNFF